MENREALSIITNSNVPSTKSAGIAVLIEGGVTQKVPLLVLPPRGSPLTPLNTSKVDTPVSANTPRVPSGAQSSRTPKKTINHEEVYHKCPWKVVPTLPYGALRVEMPYEPVLSSARMPNPVRTEIRARWSEAQHRTKCPTTAPLEVWSTTVRPLVHSVVASKLQDEWKRQRLRHRLKKNRSVA
eukprot:PhF_6_TR39581/c0_g1_i2/m.58668